MPSQIGVLNLALYGQDVARFLPGEVEAMGSGVFYLLVNTTPKSTNSLTPVVLDSIVAHAPVLGQQVRVWSSATAPGGANVNIGVYKNGSLVGALHSHNLGNASMDRVFDMAIGDVLEIRGYTDNVGVTLEIMHRYWYKPYGPVPIRRSASWLNALLEYI